MSDWYLLDDAGNPVPTDDMSAANALLRDVAKRRVARDDIGGAIISTVFLSLDHQYDAGGPPLVFETLVIGGPMDQEMDRYSTRAEAIAGHADMIRRVQEAQSGMFG